LEFVGKQLSSLTASVWIGEVDCFKIFALCPNLVNLQIDTDANGFLLQSAFEKHVCSKNFHKLETISIGSDYVMPESLFKLIFEAPCIRKIKMPIVMKKENCELLQCVVQSRLQNLEDVRLDLVLAPGCTLEDLGLMVKWLVCGAPNLKQVAINPSDTHFQAKWAAAQPGAFKFLKLLKSH